MRINGRTLYAILKDAQKYRIIIYGNNQNNLKILENKLKLIDVNIDYFVSETNFTGEPSSYFRNVYDLLYENPDEIMIVIIDDDYLRAHNILAGMGLRPGDDFKWIGRYGFENINTKYAFDPTFGCNHLGPDSRYPGFTIYGNIDDAGTEKIVILGGSTSDPALYYFKGWSEFLFEKLKNCGINAVVLAGGVAGFNTSQELLKLLRDVIPVKPSVVISYSGINNVYLLKEHPFLNEYQLEICKFLDNYALEQKNAPQIINRAIHSKTTIGISNHDDIDKYKYWLNHEKLMKYACDLHGIDFLCFLQPNLLSMDREKIDGPEKEYLLNRTFMGTYGITPEMYSNTAVEFKNRISKDKNETWLFDLSAIFDNRLDGIYLDAIHVSEDGNKIIAEEIADRLIKTVNFGKKGTAK
jgi:hypothetical protein